MVYVAPAGLTRQINGLNNFNDRAMTSKRVSHAPLIIMMMFFSVLAMDISMPTLVLGGMALSKWLILNGSMVEMKGEAA